MNLVCLWEHFSDLLTSQAHHTPPLSSWPHQSSLTSLLSANMGKNLQKYSLSGLPQALLWSPEVSEEAMNPHERCRSHSSNSSQNNRQDSSLAANSWEQKSMEEFDQLQIEAVWHTMSGKRCIYIAYLSKAPCRDCESSSHCAEDQDRRATDSPAQQRNYR